MGNIISDKKKVEALALLVVSKTGPDDDVAAVAKKVIADYFKAKKTIKEYEESSAKVKPKAKKEKLKDTDNKKQKKAASKVG